MDKRSSVFRRSRALAKAYTAELGGSLSEAQRAAIARASQLNAIAWAIRERVMGGEDIKLDLLIRIDSEARRSVEALGLPASGMKSETTDLHRYLSENYGTAEDDDDGDGGQ
jgi:hypothetical protein